MANTPRCRRHRRKYARVQGFHGQLSPLVWPSDPHTAGIPSVAGFRLPGPCARSWWGDRRGLLLALQVFVAHEDAVACSLRQTQSPLHLLVISVKLRLGFPVDPVTEGALLPSMRPPLTPTPSEARRSAGSGQHQRGLPVSPRVSASARPL